MSNSINGDVALNERIEHLFSIKQEIVHKNYCWEENITKIVLNKDLDDVNYAAEPHFVVHSLSPPIITVVDGKTCATSPWRVCETRFCERVTWPGATIKFNVRSCDKIELHTGMISLAIIPETIRAYAKICLPVDQQCNSLTSDSYNLYDALVTLDNKIFTCPHAKTPGEPRPQNKSVAGTYNGFDFGRFNIAGCKYFECPCGRLVSKEAFLREWNKAFLDMARKTEEQLKFFGF